MSRIFTELDRQATPIGEVSLRRRLDPTLGVEVYEAKLEDEFLMTSLFTAAETALATLALAELSRAHLDVVVGGLGLGYTASAVLEDPRVRSLHVIEALPQVIDWHQRELLPCSHQLVTDSRCHLVHADFFATITDGEPFGPHAPPTVDAILVDIDHSPRHLLDPSHAGFYRAEGLRRLADRLHPDGVFALWSDDPPHPDDIATMEAAFALCEANVVTFPNPLTGGQATNTVYTARHTASHVDDASLEE